MVKTAVSAYLGLQFLQLEQAWAHSAGRFGGGAGATGRTPNLTYPRIRDSPRISATLF